MAFREIDDVNIVADTSSVWGRIIITENSQLWTLAAGDLHNNRHEVVRDAVRVFADEAARVIADWIEVAKKNNGVDFVSDDGGLEDFFDHEFRPAVRIGDADASGHGFGILRDVLFAIDGRGR